MPNQSSVANHPAAIACTLYRSVSDDPQVDEQELGDGYLVLIGPFEPPQDWDAHEREAYFDGEDPSAFLLAQITPQTPDAFIPQAGDYIAAQPSPAQVVMYYLYDEVEGAEGPHFVLIRDDEEL